jgi:hypothetical protein
MQIINVPHIWKENVAKVAHARSRFWCGQIAGFKRRAQKERKPLIDVIDDWFNKNRHKHGLTDDEIDIVVDKILDSL